MTPSETLHGQATGRIETTAGSISASQGVAMDALTLTMLVALHLGVPADTALAVGAQRMLVTGAATLVTFERREVRRMTALAPRLRRRGRTMVFAVAATGDLQMALLNGSGRVLCSGAGFADPGTATVFLQGCGA